MFKTLFLGCLLLCSQAFAITEKEELECKFVGDLVKNVVEDHRNLVPVEDEKNRVIPAVKEMAKQQGWDENEVRIILSTVQSAWNYDVDSDGAKTLDEIYDMGYSGCKEFKTNQAKERS